MKIIILKIILGFLFLFLLADLVFLNWQAFKKKEPSSTISLEPQILPLTPQPTSFFDSACPLACLKIVENATSAALLPATLPTSRSTSVCSSCSSQSVKEFYIPVGAGSTSATSWTPLPGAEAYLNPANYGKIKSITFEASLRVPTGNGKVYARLYNLNDQTGIFESEVSAGGTGGSRVESGNISLTSGNKLYRVQLRTDMGYEGFLDLGRIKITIE